MELRTLDPKILQPNPANPRHTKAGDHADNQLIANIRTLGILQPPVARQENGEFIIIAGHRRVRAAVSLDLPEILVLLRNSDDGADSVRAVSENVVRCPLLGCGPMAQHRGS
ncbi:MAG: ParB N-terminal domain-containing protein [Methylocella sp.]